MILSDNELKILCKKGTEDALLEIHNKVIVSITEIVLRQYNRLDLLEDYSNDMYILFIQDIFPNIDFTREKIKPYIFAIIKNKIVDLLRQSNKHYNFTELNLNEEYVEELLQNKIKHKTGSVDKLDSSEFLNYLEETCPHEYKPAVNYIINNLLNNINTDKRKLALTLAEKFDFSVTTGTYAVDLAIMLIRNDNDTSFPLDKLDRKFRNPYKYILQRRYGKKQAEDICNLFYGMCPAFRISKVD